MADRSAAGEAWQVTPRADGSWSVTDPASGARHIAHAVSDADGAIWVAIDGDVIVVPALERRQSARPTRGTADLEAPMPAQVTAVLVEVGDQVQPGTTLVLLEAMKMELPLRAPFAARVTAIHCAAGDRVAPGRVLVDLASAEAAT